MAETDLGQSLDWDTTEIDDAEDFVLLDPGIYDFQVFDLKKERFEGSEKMAPCPKAVIGLSVQTATGITSIYENLMLNTKMAFKIAQFFKSLGAKPDPETGKVPIDWNAIIGKTGRFELDHRKYTKKDGTEGTSNNIKKFLAPEDAPAAMAPTQSSIPVPAQPVTAPQTHHNYEM